MSTVQVLLFGPLREAAGWAERSARGATVEDVWQGLCRECPPLDQHRASVRPAVDLAYAAWGAALHDGAIVAFIPPVAGGSTDVAPRVSATISRDPISVDALLACARRNDDGAVALFLGTVRNHSDGAAVTRLDYEAYVPMALAMMQDLATRTAERTAVSTLLVVHRLGELAVGEIAIAVVAGAPHRTDAFAACRGLVDAIKADVPIFKREHTAATAQWVNTGCPPPKVS